MRIKPTEDDFKTAYQRRHLDGWEALKSMAVQVAAERLLDVNRAAQERLLAEDAAAMTDQSSGLAHAREFFRRAKAIDQLFREHDELLDAAYPRGVKP